MLNARDSRWRDYGPLGFYCNFEGKRPFRQLGINVNILEPGQVLGRYHRENAQEAFLVVAGTCLLIVEGEERELTTWDFFHCPSQTDARDHRSRRGAGVVIAVGARGLRRKGLVYPVSEVALKHGAGVETETTKPGEAYADFPSSRCAYRDGWLPDIS